MLWRKGNSEFEIILLIINESKKHGRELKELLINIPTIVHRCSKQRVLCANLTRQKHKYSPITPSPSLIIKIRIFAITAKIPLGPQIPWSRLESTGPPASDFRFQGDLDQLIRNKLAIHWRCPASSFMHRFHKLA